MARPADLRTADVAGRGVDPSLSTFEPARGGRRRRQRSKANTTIVQLGQAEALVLLGVVAFTVVASAMAIGAVHVRTVLTIMPLGIACAVMVLAKEGARSLKGPAGVLVGLAAYSLLQGIPLPASLLALIDPRSFEVWQGAARPLGETLSWASLSLDPGASRVEGLKWLGYAGIFLASASLTRLRDVRWIPALIFGSALLVALVTLAHRFAGAESVFGIYAPVYAVPKFAMGPLLNPNNLAGYLNLGVFAGVGSMVARRPIAPVWVLGLGVAVIIAVSAIGGSRAGFISLALGAGTTVMTLRFVRFEGRTVPRTVLAAAGLAMAGGIGLFMLGADRDVWRSLFEEGMRKLSLISWTKQLVADHFWFGVGRGAFETAFPAYRSDVGHHVYQFAENFVMQWCSEWGVPVTFGALAAFAWWFRPGRLGLSRSPTAAAAAVGVVVLLVHNLLDLGLELASVGIALFAMLGMLWGHRERDRPHDQNDGRARGHRVLASSMAVFGVACWAVAAFSGRWSALEDRRAISREYRFSRQSGAQAPDLRPNLRAAVLRHPADPFLPLVGALVARSHMQNPLPWLARAIERDPMAGRPYLMLADVLAERGVKGQALLSLRMAVDREYGLVRHAANLAASLTKDPEELGRTASHGPGGAALLTSLASRPDMAENRRFLLEQAIDRDPTAIRPRESLAGDLLAAIEKKENPCSESETSVCARRIHSLAKDIARLAPLSDTALILRARIVAQQGDAAAALQMLEAGCPALSEASNCFRWQVAMAHQTRNIAALERSAEAYMGVACARPVACAAAATWLGERYEKLGERAKALRMFERAAEEGDSAKAWLRVAKLAENLGLPSSSAHAKNRAKRSSGRDEPVEGPQRNDELLRSLLDD